MSARPTYCQRCGYPVHSAGTRADDRPAVSRPYRGKGLCTTCAPARATSGRFGRFQLHSSQLTTTTNPTD